MQIITITAIGLLMVVVARFGGVWPTLARLLAYPPVANWLIKRAMRCPYSPIIKSGKLYMDRFWLFNPYPDTGASGADRRRWQFPISIRIHHIVLPDQDRDLHDHPWNARTVILRGWYREVRSADPYEWPIRRNPGDTATLAYGEFHRITRVAPGGAWTLFISGPYRGTWGFLVNDVKVQWREYLGLNK